MRGTIIHPAYQLVACGLKLESLRSTVPFDLSLCYQKESWNMLVMFLRGKPLSGEHISMELNTPEPSVSHHLALQTQDALGSTAITFHQSIKDFSVRCKIEAAGVGGKYFFPFAFLSSVTSLVCLHVRD